MNKKQIEKITRLLSEYENENKLDYELYNYVSDPDLEDINDLDELRDYLRDLAEDNDILSVEIIYYSNAMDYLREHDASLQESLSLASDMGYDLNTVNSEILASLLATENRREDFITDLDELINFLDDNDVLNDDDEEGAQEQDN
jgi:hypothetical protein